MAATPANRLARLRLATRNALRGPQLMAFLPALALAAFWLGGESVLLLVALGIPVLFAIVGGFDTRTAGRADSLGETSALIDGAMLERMADDHLADASEGALLTACLLIEVDGFDQVAQRHGEETVDMLRDRVRDRLTSSLRSGDRVVRIGDTRYAVLLQAKARLDLEAMLQLARRAQMSIEEPVSLEATTLYMSASVGFSQSARLPDGASGAQLIEAAQTALREAVRNGPSAIRAYSTDMKTAEVARRSLQGDIRKALENGQIRPWFQPQLCTDTGRVSGAEILARWVHPDRGLIPPADFLPTLTEAGLMERLGEVMLFQSLTALVSWDKIGLDVPVISINVSESELRNPKLADKIKWELDRFDLPPKRLCVEVLESVIAFGDDEVVTRNIDTLSEMGCHIDLDDFGTGNASISTLRRFRIHRLKIDRSFVTRVDRDEEQRRMITAILSMAERLGLETLAEGVESVGEHAMMSQLGCNHVQGFGIARPMPPEQLGEWIEGHRAKLAQTSLLGRSAGRA